VIRMGLSIADREFGVPAYAALSAYWGVCLFVEVDFTVYTSSNCTTYYTYADNAVCARTPSVILTEKGKVGVDGFQNEIMAFSTNSTKIVNEYFTFSE